MKWISRLFNTEEISTGWVSIKDELPANGSENIIVYDGKQIFLASFNNEGKDENGLERWEFQSCTRCRFDVDDVSKIYWMYSSSLINEI